MEFDIFIRHSFEALKISSQNRLAILLGINRAGITQAKKKGTVPARQMDSGALQEVWHQSGLDRNR